MGWRAHAGISLSPGTLADAAHPQVASGFDAKDSAREHIAVHLSFEALGRLLAEGKLKRTENLEGHSRSVPGVSLL
jgi:hypothetical protein